MADLFSDPGTALDGLTSQMSRLESLTGKFGTTLSKSLVDGIAKGKGFDEVLKGLGDKLISLSLSSALKPLESIVGGVFNSLTGAATSLLSGALTGASTGGGGVFNALSASNTAAPVRGAAPVIVNMAISTPDAASFQSAESQVSAAIARAAARGQRSL